MATFDLMTQNNQHVDIIKLMHDNDLISTDEYDDLSSNTSVTNNNIIAYLSNTLQINDKSITKVIASLFQLPTIDLLSLDQHNFPKESLPASMIYKDLMIPFQIDDKAISIACYSPDQIAILKDYQYILQTPINIYLSSYTSICSIINLWKCSTIYGSFTSQTDSHNTPDQHTIDTTHLVEHMLTDGIIRNASDIHIQPDNDALFIRFRIDGILNDITTLPPSCSAAVTNRLKILSNLDISETRLPQDGRFSFRSFYDHNRDCRVNTCPSIHGEKTVVRLLNPNQSILSINELTLDDTQHKILITSINQPQGLILITGPTGSGKTQTLYTLLNTINDSSKNIITIENPVEITIPKTHQINISHKIQLDFSNALRASLRQDPDIIMIGEIRDKETALMAIQASQTGHLVFATLHSNNTQDTLTRLLNMGIKPFNIVNSLSLIIAQRLIRKLCPLCKQPDTQDNNSLLTHASESLKSPLYVPGGCDHCTDGFKGRSAVFEFLKINRDIKNILLQHNALLELKSYCNSNDIPTLWNNATLKAQGGITSLQEIIRVIHLE